MMELYNKYGADCGYLQELGLLGVLRKAGVEVSTDPSGDVVISSTVNTTHNENHFYEEKPVVTNTVVNHVESHTSNTTVSEEKPTCVVDMSGTINTGVQVFGNTSQCDKMLVLL